MEKNNQAFWGQNCPFEGILNCLPFVRVTYKKKMSPLFKDRLYLAHN